MGTNDAQINYKMSVCDGVNLLVGGKSHKDSHLRKEMGWRKSPEGCSPTSQESLRDGSGKRRAGSDRGAALTSVVAVAVTRLS